MGLLRWNAGCLFAVMAASSPYAADVCKVGKHGQWHKLMPVHGSFGVDRSLNF